MCEAGGRGTVALGCLHTVASASVPDCWHESISALVEFTGTFLPPSFQPNIESEHRFLVPLLASVVADALPSMAITM